MTESIVGLFSMRMCKLNSMVARHTRVEIREHEGVEGEAISSTEGSLQETSMVFS
jgi:hypothetical protein